MMRTTGEIIKGLRESRGLTQQQLADIVGAKTYTTITKWESGENFPKGKDIIRLSGYFKVSSDYILGLEEDVEQPAKLSDYDYFPVSIAAGLPVGVDSVTEYEVGKISIPDSIMGKYAGHSNIFTTRINGESMNRIIPNGSLIAVKGAELESLHDGDLVVYSHEHEYSVKRFFNDPVQRRIIFRPDSTDNRFTDYTISYDDSANLRIHGKVVLYVVEL
ncbi:XRE family transcriptional regulator [Paenibacillaceae bacterium WGS1546]|uniref:XRE family transcriptional regulator n=1 Tax=Cohnella sp. WGS1546 TaxID=3366810 RepID=UPI00372D3DC9